MRGMLWSGERILHTEGTETAKRPKDGKNTCLRDRGPVGQEWSGGGGMQEAWENQDEGSWWVTRFWALTPKQTQSSWPSLYALKGSAKQRGNPDICTPAPVCPELCHGRTHIFNPLPDHIHLASSTSCQNKAESWLNLCWRMFWASQNTFLYLFKCVYLDKVYRYKCRNKGPAAQNQDTQRKFLFSSKGR